MRKKSFMALCLSGECACTTKAFDRFVGRWHATKTKLSLLECLGMTETEYAQVQAKPDALPEIVSARFEQLEAAKAKKAGRIRTTIQCQCKDCAETFEAWAGTKPQRCPACALVRGEQRGDLRYAARLTGTSAQFRHSRARRAARP